MSKNYKINNLLITKYIKVIKNSYEKNGGELKKIVFPEGKNKTIQEVGLELLKRNIAQPVFIFNIKEEVPAKVKEHSIKMKKSNIDNCARLLVRYKNGRYNYVDSRLLCKTTEYFAAILVKSGEADCFLGGIDKRSNDILSAIIRCIGSKTNDNKESIFSTMLLTRKDEIYFFSDPSMHIEPDEVMLAKIACGTSYIAKKFTNKRKIKTALLSYSTALSGNEPSLNIIKNASDILKKYCDMPKVSFISEIQFDAAFNPKIMKKKMNITTSNLKPCDVYVFPNLNAANIGYKIAQQMGNFESIGPILVNTALPANDLSRGSSWDEVFNTSVLTIFQTFFKN